MPYVNIPSKPDAPIAYELFEGDKEATLLLVFVNGLGLPQTCWRPAISLLQESSLAHKPAMLTYDRFGQGATTTRDPVEKLPGKEPGYGHTLDDVVDDLHELLETVVPQFKRIAFACNSIGGHVTRRYAERYPGTVEGLLILDSNPGSVEFTDFWPDPHAIDFSQSEMLPDDVSLDVYTAAYKTVASRFNSDAKNPEGFDRRNIKHIYPDPSKPKLKGSKTENVGPWIIVAGHEFETFSKQEWEMMKVPPSVAARYTQPAWQKYNEGLCKLTDPERATGPLIAPGCGHFIQKDNPAFVAEQLQALLAKVGVTA